MTRSRVIEAASVFSLLPALAVGATLFLAPGARPLAAGPRAAPAAPFTLNTATIAVMLPVLKDAAAPEMMTSVLFAALWCWAVVPFVLGR